MSSENKQGAGESPTGESLVPKAFISCSRSSPDYTDRVEELEYVRRFREISEEWSFYSIGHSIDGRQPYAHQLGIDL